MNRFVFFIWSKDISFSLLTKVDVFQRFICDLGLVFIFVEKLCLHCCLYKILHVCGPIETCDMLHLTIDNPIPKIVSFPLPSDFAISPPLRGLLCS